MSESTLFPTQSADDELLIAAYQRQGRTLDDLPYTDAFEAICDAVRMGDQTTQAERRAVFHRLHNIRKAGRLARLGKAAEKPVSLPPEALAQLEQMVIDALGKLGLRDQLPYTDQFDQIVQRFNAQVALSLTPHQVWRLVARLAK